MLNSQRLTHYQQTIQTPITPGHLTIKTDKQTSLASPIQKHLTIKTTHFKEVLKADYFDRSPSIHSKNNQEYP